MGIADDIDLTPEQRTEIIQLLDRYLPQTTVWAYGSCVTRTNRPRSDLDLVVFTTSEQDEHVSLIKEAFEKGDQQS